jgi:hypothetical protein
MANGKFLDLAAKHLEEFLNLRARGTFGDYPIIFEPVSRKRPDSFKVWFGKMSDAVLAKAKWGALVITAPDDEMTASTGRAG